MRGWVSILTDGIKPDAIAATRAAGSLSRSSSSIRRAHDPRRSPRRQHRRLLARPPPTKRRGRAPPNAALRRRRARFAKRGSTAATPRGDVWERSTKRRKDYLQRPATKLVFLSWALERLGGVTGRDARRSLGQSFEHNPHAAPRSPRIGRAHCCTRKHSRPSCHEPSASRPRKPPPPRAALAPRAPPMLSRGHPACFTTRPPTASGGPNWGAAWPRSTATDDSTAADGYSAPTSPPLQASRPPAARARAALPQRYAIAADTTWRAPRRGSARDPPEEEDSAVKIAWHPGAGET